MDIPHKYEFHVGKLVVVAQLIYWDRASTHFVATDAQHKSHTTRRRTFQEDLDRVHMTWN